MYALGALSRRYSHAQRIGRGVADERVLQVVQILRVAVGAQMVVGTLGALKYYAGDARLGTAIADNIRVTNSCE